MKTWMKWSRCLSTAMLVLGLAFGGAMVTGCEEDAGDHLDEAIDDAGDAAESVGDAAEEGAEEMDEQIEDLLDD